MSGLHTSVKAAAGDSPSIENIEHAYVYARDLLLSQMKPSGQWEGRLSSSALSTATAVSAFAVVDNSDAAEHMRGGIQWLIGDQNEDGGWGDSPNSPSNISTSMLVLAALNLADSRNVRVSQECIERADGYLNRSAGITGPERAMAVKGLYGKDSTFAAPILANCALAPSRDALRIAWCQVPRLPFELATLPRALFRVLHLRVVSYALPALIAIGQLVHAKRGTRNPALRLLRNTAIAPTLRMLQSIQPVSGGFLEAVPLTAFVVMSLGASGHSHHRVVQKGVDFLKRLVRADGSWPIDANLSTWLTSMAVEALASGGGCPIPASEKTREWIFAQQHVVNHPYTNSEPGGWAWTDLSGGVPDTDDTSAALIALSHLDSQKDDAIRKGVSWLLKIQNRDGGWPTFCRGWGKLPFDRSAADLTAHALQALSAWRVAAPQKRLERALHDGFQYLRTAQRHDGAWEPMWFGNQSVQGNRNPVYGTARVLGACTDLGRGSSPEAKHAIEYLINAQNSEGSWGGDSGAKGTIEETALAVSALCRFDGNEKILDVCMRGAGWLVEAVNEGRLAQPAPIGLYFAKLWYSEMLYPVIWTVRALGCMLSLMGRPLPRVL